MDKKRIGNTLEVSALGLGCMGMTGFYGAADRKECEKLIQTAFEKGITLFDTADNYGLGENEELLGRAVAPFRKHITIATKVGVIRSKDAISINGTPEYIKQQCMVSLRRLGISTIDLYYLHHLDSHTPIEETMHAMKELVREGKIRHIGLGEVGTDNIRRAHKIHPITAIQAEYSLFTREAEERLIPLCDELGIGFIACAPLCRGLLTGTISSFSALQPNDFRRLFPRFSENNLPHNNRIVGSLRTIADRKACSLSQLALGWIASRFPSIVPLFGTTQASHLVENLSPLQLSTVEMDAIHKMLSHTSVQGDRLTDSARPLYRTD